MDFPRTLLFRSIYASFIGVLLFSFHYETTTKAKFIFYAKEKGVQPQKHEDQLDKDGGKAGEVVQNNVSCSKFQYHSFTQNNFGNDPI